MSNKDEKCEINTTYMSVAYQYEVDGVKKQPNFLDGHTQKMTANVGSRDECIDLAKDFTRSAFSKEGGVMSAHTSFRMGDTLPDLTGSVRLDRNGQSASATESVGAIRYGVSLDEVMSKGLDGFKSSSQSVDPNAIVPAFQPPVKTYTPGGMP